MENEYHKRLCLKSQRQCNPAREMECLCWWLSSGPEDFDERFRNTIFTVSENQPVTK